jgi:predicted phosphodiesterase
MKIALISDPHMMWDKPIGRVDDVWLTSIGKMEFVLDYCTEHELPLLIAGDLTDKPRSWLALPKIIDLFRRYRKAVKVYAVYGQHDAYMRESRSSTILGSLINARLVSLLGGVPRILNSFKKIAKQENIFAYGCSWGDVVPDPRKTVGNGKNILVIHAPISHNESHITEAKYFMRDQGGYDLILCGDIHKSFELKFGSRWIVNTGPMMRGVATKEMFEHQPHFLVWDSNDESIETVDIPHTLAKHVLTRDHIESSKEVDEILESFLSAVKKGIRIRHQRLSKTFKIYAKDNGVDRVISDIILNMLMEVEDTKDE